MDNKTHKDCINALNDLIQINNDRIAGYTKAIDNLKDDRDGDLKSLFGQMVSQSNELNSELSQKVTSYGGETTDSTTVAGKIYRTWMDVKAFFGGDDREAVLNNCETGEDAAQKAYQMVLDDNDVMQETKALVSKQKSELRNSHDKIKALRDAAKLVS